MEVTHAEVLQQPYGDEMSDHEGLSVRLRPSRSPATGTRLGSPEPES